MAILGPNLLDLLENHPLDISENVYANNDGDHLTLILVYQKFFFPGNGPKYLFIFGLNLTLLS